MNKAKISTIYSNYDLWDNYEKDVRDAFAEEGNDDPSDDAIWDRIYLWDQDSWQCAKDDIEKFLDGKKWLIFGVMERWNGKFPGWEVCSNLSDILRMVSDRDYLNFFDDAGHLYFKCSHHDGTNILEIRQLTDRGVGYYERWEDHWYDKRDAAYILGQLLTYYTKLPRFAKKMYGFEK